MSITNTFACGLTLIRRPSWFV